MTVDRRTPVFVIKVIHTVIFLVVSASILHILVAGLRNRPSRWTGAAVLIATAEVIVFLANRGRCPLTQLAEGMGTENGRVSDILLPRWFADRIPQLCTPPLVVGIVALLWCRFRPDGHNHRWPWRTSRRC